MSAVKQSTTKKKPKTFFSDGFREPPGEKSCRITIKLVKRENLGEHVIGHQFFNSTHTHTQVMTHMIRQHNIIPI